MARRLIVLVAIPTLLGLALAGLRIADETRSAAAYGQVGRLAELGRQVTGLTQAVQNERAGTAAFIAQGRPAAGLPALHRQYALTDRWAATVRRLDLQLGPGYPVQTRANAAAVLASIAELPGLRRQAVQTSVPALTVINEYSAATASMFAINDGLADLSGNPTLITSVRALGSLSRMKDQAAQQQAILGVALAQGHFAPGALTALTSAQARQASDFQSFRGSATPEQNWAVTTTLAATRARQAEAIEQRAIAAGNGPLAFGAPASQQWQAGMSYTAGWMRHVEQQLTNWITSDAQGLQRSAVRSATITGAAALAGLALILLVTLMVARSMARPLRRLDAADQARRDALRLAGEQARERASISALSERFFRRSYALQERLLRLMDSLELNEDDPERLAGLFQIDHLVTRMRRESDSALVLAGHQPPRDPGGPFLLVDVVRAAVSEIEQYDRIRLDIQPGIAVIGRAAADTVHLLAELLENATRFSARTAQVTVSAKAAHDGGSLITITNGGTGLSEQQLRQLNWQLAHPPRADAAPTRQVGLFAVAHLAARHGIGVMLGTPPGGGTTAEVHVPARLITHDGAPGGRLGPAGGRLGRAGGIPRAGVGQRGNGQTAALDVPFSALRFAASPEPPWEPETGPREPVLAAPAPAPPAAETSADDADQEAGTAPAAESAETIRRKMAGFQRGAHRARSTVQTDRGVQERG